MHSSPELAARELFATALDAFDPSQQIAPAPPGSDENYGSGHEQASGGALRPEVWDAFIGGLGFAPERSAAA